ncbi:hypothetical protein QBC35DRAFT_550340, partial [Podospora australis]
GQATIYLRKIWYATCGMYDVDTESTARGVTGNLKAKAAGSGTEVIDQREVELGATDNAGVMIHGSSREMECTNGTPCFVKPDHMGCFALRTRADFTPQEAKANKYFVGFTSSLRPNIGPYASFAPQPGQLYHVKPSSTLYVAVGHFQSHDLVGDALKEESNT